MGPKIHFIIPHKHFRARLSKLSWIPALLSPRQRLCCNHCAACPEKAKPNRAHEWLSAGTSDRSNSRKDKPVLEKSCSQFSSPVGAGESPLHSWHATLSPARGPGTPSHLSSSDHTLHKQRSTTTHYRCSPSIGSHFCTVTAQCQKREIKRAKMDPFSESAA